MHIWWRNKISQLSKVEKPKDLVRVKGGGESDLRFQEPAAWETEKERRDGGKERRDMVSGVGGEDDRCLVGTKLSWCVGGNALSVHCKDHQNDSAWFNWYRNGAFSPRRQTRNGGLQTCGRAAKGLFNIHEGAFKSLLQWSPPTAATAASFPTCLYYQYTHIHTRFTFHSHSRHCFSQTNLWPDETLSRCS